jgi:uncharacterized membrane protein YebE (DUF533 family)
MMRLTRDAFVALATVAWADGSVSPEEASALIEAARASGLREADLEVVTAATRTPVTLDHVGSLALGAEEREFVYAVALWLARADNVVVDRERIALAKLGDLLGLREDVRQRAALVATALVRFTPEEPEPSLRRLAKAISRGEMTGFEPTIQG